MLLVGSVLEPWQIGATAVLCTFLGEFFDDVPWHLRTGISRDLIYLIAFFGAGVFVREVNRNRRVVEQHLDEIERQSEARREAEEQLRVLIETSPAAIVTADGDGTVLMANEAAYRMLGASPEELAGKPIHRYLPSLRNVSGPADLGASSFAPSCRREGSGKTARGSWPTLASPPIAPRRDCVSPRWCWTRRRT